jgi:tetratricopeptide (TPR) repeat protein
LKKSSRNDDENYDFSHFNTYEFSCIQFRNATLGLNYKEMGDTARAIYNFQTSIENDPKDIESIIYIGNLYAAQRNPLAMEYFNSALKLRPKSVDALFGRAVFAQKMNFKKQALLDYKKVNFQILPELTTPFRPHKF